MSRTWCTTLEESIVSEYVDSILNKKKKTRPPQSPYQTTQLRSGSVRPASARPPRKAKIKNNDRPKTSCKVRKSGSNCSVRSAPDSPYCNRNLAKSDSFGSISSQNTSQLSVYSTNVQRGGSKANPWRHYCGKKVIKRVVVFTSPEQSRVIVASSYSDLLERSHHHHLYTSDGTPLTGPLYPLLPHNCHLFRHDPTLKQQDTPKPKVIWTKDGVMVTGAQPKRTTKPHLSTRMLKLVAGRRQRVQILKNGEHRGAAGVSVMDAALQNMLTDATDLLRFAVSSFYTVSGKKLCQGELVPHLIPTSHTLGPLWAVKGKEMFSFVGAYNWCKQEHKAIRQELKISQDKLDQAYLEEASEESVSSLQDKVSELEETSRTLRDTIVTIAGEVEEEEEEGAKFKVKNMPTIGDNSRLIGRPNTKVNVHVNGRDVCSKVVVIPGGTFNPTLHWFLDQCDKLHSDTLGGTTQKTSQVYDSEGSPIKKILDILPDADVYLSYGEPFSKPKTKNFLTISYYGVTAHKFPESSNFVVKRPLEDDETNVSPKMFSLVSGIPDSYKLSGALLGLKQKTLKFTVQDMSSKHIFDDHVFLQHKTYPQRVIYPCLVSNPRLSSATSGKPTILTSTQIWLYTSNHQLRPKSFPKLCLSISEHCVVLKGEDGGAKEGFMVSLSARSRQTWDPTTNGRFVCSSTGLYLTCLEDPATLYSKSSHAPFVRDSIKQHEYLGMPDIPGGEEAFLVALPALEKPEQQRWAFKQENIALLGQWKLCNIDNPEWSKECLSWPTTDSKLSWPIEGLLLNKAPSLKEPKSPNKTAVSCPVLRLRVSRNGSTTPARHITAPDLTNMKKDLAIKRRSLDRQPDRQPDTQRWLDKYSKGAVQEDREKVSELEFRLFLDKCGSVLELITPPTRLFTATGDELVSLESLERDAEVFVSCGAEFEMPDSEKNARNSYLYDVSHDINKMKTFCSAIAPTSYVASVSEIGRHAPVRLQVVTESELQGVLNQSDSMSDILQIAEVNKSIEDKSVEPSQIILDEQAFHFKSHTGQNESDLGMLEQFPWRNPAFTAGLVKNKLDWEHASSGEGEADSDCDSVRSIKSCSSVSSLPGRPSSRGGRLCNQWIYKECRFLLLDNPQYVLSTDVDNSVELALYDKNSPEQCWTLDQEFVYSSNGQVLTVTQPSVIPPNSVDYAGAKLKTAPVSAVVNGNTNQKWAYDQTTGHLVALAAASLCRGISAALITNICTFAVTSSDNAQQPTYIMENPGIAGIPEDNTHIYVCGSCAATLRDRYTIEKIETTTFVCSIGYYCSTTSLSIKCSLVALGGLDGLQPGRAFGSLYLWESLLPDLKQQTSLKSIKDIVKQTLELECPNEGLVLVRCYLNGARPPNHRGHLFLARSFEEILRKSLVDLKAGRPLSRIFLADGNEILSFQSLLDSHETGTSDDSSFETKNVPYKELFISAGEGFIRPKKRKGVLSFKKRVKMYSELNKLDVMSLQSLSQRSVAIRPPHLPVSRQSIPVYITRNGDLVSTAIRVVAYSIDSLLEAATARLNMPTAARKVFASSGAEVVSWGEVFRGQGLVVSAGQGLVMKGQSQKKNKWIHRKVGNEK